MVGSIIILIVGINSSSIVVAIIVSLICSLHAYTYIYICWFALSVVAIYGKRKSGGISLVTKCALPAPTDPGPGPYGQWLDVASRNQKHREQRVAATLEWT